MENTFSNFINQQYFYPFYPFVQYYNPKVCDIYNINNNLEDSTIQTPQTPEVKSKQEETRRQHLNFNSEDLQSLSQEQKREKTVHGKLKTHRKKSNDDYKPYERHSKRKSNFLKENRNVLPIKIRQMLSFLTREKKSHEIIQKFIEKGNIKIIFNEKKFYAFLKMKKERVGNYVTLTSLKTFLGVEPEKAELYPVHEQLQFLKIIRVMFDYYLKHISALCSLTSNRIQSEQKIQHVRVQRQLLEFLQKSLDQ